MEQQKPGFEWLRGAIFDLDGTLLDSMGAWAEVDRRFLERRGLTLTPDYTEAVKTMGFRAAADYTIDRYGLNELPEALMEEWTEMTREMYAREIPLKLGAADYLRCLAARGVRLGIATSSKEALFRPALERCGVWDLFCTAVTVAEVQCGKESPEIYLETARRMDAAPSECAVFEDILPGVRAAKAAGFHTVAVCDPSSAAEEPALRREADRCIRSFCELLEELPAGV